VKHPISKIYPMEKPA